MNEVDRHRLAFSEQLVHHRLPSPYQLRLLLVTSHIALLCSTVTAPPPPAPRAVRLASPEVSVCSKVHMVASGPADEKNLRRSSKEGGVRGAFCGRLSHWSCRLPPPCCCTASAAPLWTTPSPSLSSGLHPCEGNSKVSFQKSWPRTTVP